MAREEMLSLVIQKFGFEHEYTIQFAKAMKQMEYIELEDLLLKILNLEAEEDFEFIPDDLEDLRIVD